MSVTAKLIGALWLMALAVGTGFAVQQSREERGRLLLDLDRRGAVVAGGFKAAIDTLVGDDRSAADAAGVLKRIGRSEDAIIVFDERGGVLGSALPVGARLPPATREMAEAIQNGREFRGLVTNDGLEAYVVCLPLLRGGKPDGALAAMLDASGLENAAWGAWKRVAIRTATLAAALSFAAVLVFRVGVMRPIARMAEWARALQASGAAPPPDAPDRSLFGPLSQEVSGIAKSLFRARADAEREAALRVAGDTVWTADRLKQFVQIRLDGPLFVVSNREPVSHVWKGKRIETQAPASGMVTALEPVLRACGGVWVAHGSGDADREVVDAAGRVGVPADHPAYALRRVWLTPEEEEGYYYGFCNEGMWPLCHIVHTRPQFRPSDWQQYQSVNQKFAEAVLGEIATTRSPLVLIQDYHFALLPALIKKQRPDARVAIFWHVPWPNSEAFGICPWQDDLLRGMLGADLIGFHTQYHCNNFLETVDRAVEARIDREAFSVVRGDHTTYVKPFPISVTSESGDGAPDPSRSTLLAQHGIPSAEFMGVGVERVDYTKGLAERFRAVGRFFERWPQYRGKLIFVQLAAPSRTRILRYQQHQEEVDAVVKEVNERLQSGNWKPIHFLHRHHEHREIWPFYRRADFCMVTSLHDGMNLVAKEFVAARDDDDGVLILSRFTGAAHELRDAVLVNPYDVDEMAGAIHTAVEMQRQERTSRMTRMRRVVREHNVYRWGGLLLSELARIPEKVVAETNGGA